MSYGKKPLKLSSGTRKLLDAVSGAADASDLTVLLDLVDELEVAFALEFAYTSATAWAWTVEAGHKDEDGNWHYGLIQYESVAAGVAALSDYAPSKSTGEAKSIEIGPYNGTCQRIRLILSCTGADAGGGDTVTVTGTGLVQS